MKIAAIIVRILMGLMFLFASVVVLFNLVPPPPPGEMTGDMKTFHEGILASHYLLTTLKIFELLCAISYLTGRYVPLATIVLFPATLNILLYHSFVDPKTLPIAILLMAGNLFMAYYYRESYRGLFVAK
jgi:putative oxidoreductase